MKTYEVELKYTSYTTITVEANSPEDAERLISKEKANENE